MIDVDHACDWCTGYATALRDIAAWLDDDITDGLFADGSGDDAARSIAARLRDQAGRAALETPATQPEDHASPNCACGINDAGQRYVDPICREP